MPAKKTAAKKAAKKTTGAQLEQSITAAQAGADAIVSASAPAPPLQGRITVLTRMRRKD